MEPDTGEGDTGEDVAGVRDVDEHEADQYTGRLLIGVREDVRAESLVGEHLGALARELGVTRRLAELRQADFAREAHIFRTADEWRSA